MKTLSILILLIAINTISSSGQTFISDSITYRYGGSGDPDESKAFLKQLGYIDQVTDKTKVIREGNIIYIITKLKKEGRYKVISITIQSETDLRRTILEDNSVMDLQLISGYAQGSVYFEELDYYNPINSAESPYMSVNWIVYDRTGDETYERLELKVINSKDIIQIYHCHLKQPSSQPLIFR